MSDIKEFIIPTEAEIKAAMIIATPGFTRNNGSKTVIKVCFATQPTPSEFISVFGESLKDGGVTGSFK